MASMPPTPQVIGGPPGMPTMPTPMPMPPGAPGIPGAPMMPGAKPPMPPPVMPHGAKPGQPGAKAGEPGQPGEEEVLAPTLSFWQQPWVQNVLPFVTSLAVHCVIIVLAVMFATVVVQQVQKIVEEQTIIPESTMADAGPPGGVPNVGLGGDPLRQAMQNTTPDGGTPEGWANKAGPLDAQVQAEGGGSGDSDSSGLIGIGAGGLGKGNGMGTGGGGGAGGGTGDGSGPLAMFGTPGGGAIGPKGPVFGNGGNARKIVFVCDATGTMINKMATLKNELAKAIDKLKPIQAFNVVFYYDGENTFTVDKNALIQANADNKRKSLKFLDDVTSTGPTDPLPALRIAFKQQPELIYFLSDGEFNNLKSYKEVMEEINKLNPGKKIKVNTILFETYDTEAEEVMKTIAKDNGGTYRFVKQSDINE